MEHAFEAALEAGEIPHHLLFTEMVFQATAQQNYKRAVNLVNTMCYAPFQISEEQWTDLFLKNRVKISSDSLKMLLDALGNCGVSSEPTIVNLWRTLCCLCGAIGSDIEEDTDCDGTDEVSTSKSNDREGMVGNCGIIESGDCSLDGYEMGNGMGLNEVDDSSLPSANEILCSWKESRNNRIFGNLSDNIVVNLSLNKM